MVFLISVLIVYGITLILVQGKIFEPTKIKLGKFVHSLGKKVDPSDDDIRERLAMGTDVSTESIVTWNKALKILGDSPSKDTESAVIKVMNDIIKIEQGGITTKYGWQKLLYRFLCKLQELLQCMMCTGFWVGLLLCLVTSIFSISIFGIPLQIVTSAGYNVLVTMFLMACLFSGTTWIINSVVDLLFEVKENLGGFLKRD